jgi:hypothetical protein
MVDPAVTELISLIREGGGMVGLGVILTIAFRIVRKAEALMDGTAAHRTKVEETAAKTEGHLAALRAALA